MQRKNIELLKNIIKKYNLILNNKQKTITRLNKKIKAL